jgi:hypothetical protein
MKFKNTLVLLFAFVSLTVLGTSFLNGPANRGQDKTGSPISSGTCLNCHSSGEYSPSLLVALFDGETEVDSYEPGKIYTLKYQLINSGSPAAFGFQTVALNDNNEGSGTFSNIPNGFRKINLKDVDYVEHSSPRPTSFFEVNWTAPEDATEAVTFYSAAVAANGNNNTGGDGADTDEITIQLNTSSAEDIASDLIQEPFTLKSNLVQKHVSIDLKYPDEDYTFYIYDTQGSLIKTHSISKYNATQILLPVSDLASSMYYLQGINKMQGKTVRFFKN